MSPLTLDPQLYSKFGRLAAERKVPVQALVEEACKDYLEWADLKMEAGEQ